MILFLIIAVPDDPLALAPLYEFKDDAGGGSLVVAGAAVVAALVTLLIIIAVPKRFAVSA